MSTTLAVPVSPEAFFITGGTLSRDASSYIERQADTDLYTNLLQGEFCYVLNSRQMGKSSLMVRTAERLKAAGITVAVLDLTAIGQNLTPEQWYDGLLNRLGRQLDLEDELDDFYQDNTNLGPLQRWQEALLRVVLPNLARPVLGQKAGEEGRLILFVDEIDVVRSLPFSADEFFAGIRQFYVGRALESELNRLTFCLLGTATPADLVTDTRVSPFNIGKRIELTDFTPAEAAPLAQGLGEKGEMLLARILYWTGGHPYLTQRLCRAVAEAGAKTAASVDRICSELFLVHKAKESDDNLTFVRNRLLRSEADLAGLLDLYQQMRNGKRIPDDETNSLTSIIKLSGVARVEHGELTVRNRIYAHVFDKAWVERHMPDAEKRRQRAAYRTGLFRAITRSAIVLLAMVLLTAFAFQQRHEALQSAEAQRDAGDKASHFLYIANLNLIAAAWEKNDVGHVLDLLEETRNSKDVNFEWGYWNHLCHLDTQTMNEKNDSGNPDAIRYVALSADGKRLVVSEQDGTANVWDMETGKMPFTLRGHTGEINSIAITPDGRYVLTGSQDSTAKGWDSQTGRGLCSLQGSKAPVTSVALSANGALGVTASEQETVSRLWNLQTGKALRTFVEKDGAINAVALSADGTRVLTGNETKIATLWNAQTGKELQIFKGHTGAIYAVAFSADGKYIVTGSEDKTARVWDINTGKTRFTLSGHAATISALALSSNGKRLATGSMDNTTRLWDLETGKQLFTIKGHTDSVYSVALSSDGERLVTGSRDATAKVWNLRNDRAYHVIKAHEGPINALVLTTNGKRLVTASADKTAKLWDLETGQALRTFSGHTGAITSLFLSKDGRLLVTSSKDETVKIWEVATGKTLLTLEDPTSIPIFAALSPDNSRLVTMSNGEGEGKGEIKVWDVNTGKEIFVFKSNTSFLSGDLSADGKFLLTGDENDGTARLWEISTGKELLTLEGHYSPINSVAISLEGTRFVTGSQDITPKVWDAETGEELFSLRGHTDSINSVAISSDGRRILTGSDDGTVKIWDMETGKELLTLPGTAKAINAVTISADNKHIVTGDEAGIVRIYSA